MPADLIHFIAFPKNFPTNTVSGGGCQPPELTFFQKALDCLGRHGALQAANVLNSAQANKMVFISLERFRAHFQKGRPLGDDRFLRKAEAMTNRELCLKKSGRPKKDKN